MPALKYQTPGVYYERLDTSAPAISAIRMDVAGFVGIARRGPIDTPVPVQSWRQFEAHFGGVSRAGFLGYAVRAFFENGGRRCWVVRVASRENAGGASAASSVVRSTASSDVWKLDASSPGAWGNGISATLRETHRSQARTEPTASTPQSASVSSVSGFRRYTHVRLSQDGAGSVWRVVSDVDPYRGLIHWVHPDPASRTPYDEPLIGLDLSQPVLVESVEYDLLVYEQDYLVGLYESLSLVPEHDRYGPKVLAPLYASHDAHAGIEDPYVPSPLPFAEAADGADILPPPPRPVVITELRTGRPILDLSPLDTDPRQRVRLQGGAEGLALLRPGDFAGADAGVDSERGFRALDRVAEVTAVAVPDLHAEPSPPPPPSPIEPCVADPCLEEVADRPRDLQPASLQMPPAFSVEEIFRVQADLVQHCEMRRDRIAILDPPSSTGMDEADGIRAMSAWRDRFDSAFAALYWPWVRAIDPLREEDLPGRELTRDIPPSGHVAGQFARSDFAVGVHRAPANAPLGWAQDVTLLVDDDAHGRLNSLGVNVIRSLPGRGIRIMGARTLSRDVSWRYVNVRRLLIMITRSIYASLQWAAFEPNDSFTRAKVRLAISSFLLALWQRGALVGGTADAAYFVKCDETTTTRSDIDNGRLICLVGVAPSQPYEFVVVRVGRTDNEFDVTESTRGGA